MSSIHRSKVLHCRSIPSTPFRARIPWLLHSTFYPHLRNTTAYSHRRSSNSYTLPHFNMATTTTTETGKRRVICVYCGSSPGNSPVHMQAARELAKAFHENGIQLVYGGGTSGIMGELARTLVALSGPDAVFGVIPDALIKYERANGGSKEGASGGAAATAGGASGQDALHEATYGRTTVVPDMHSRKQLMARTVIEGAPGSGFCALSGGYGTLEELMEMTTWNQLGIHGVGVCVLNIAGFYDGLLSWIRVAVAENFVSQQNATIIVEAKTPKEVIDALATYRVSEGRFKLDWSQK